MGDPGDEIGPPANPCDAFVFLQITGSLTFATSPPGRGMNLTALITSAQRMPESEMINARGVPAAGFLGASFSTKKCQRLV